jgi:uncharacterized protein (DUF3820 family)
MKQDKPSIDSEILIQLARMRMPFGRYKDRILCDLPEPYLVWFSRKGFPSGKLGLLLETLYEIKVNGLEYLLKPFKEKA